MEIFVKLYIAIGQSAKLNCPFDGAVNNDNQLLAAKLYGNSNCISFFALDGSHVSRIGTQGSSRARSIEWTM